MKLSIRNIDKENWNDIIDLQVHDSQKDYIESNVYSIAESKIYEYWIPSAIYLNDIIIGFTMFGYIHNENRVWLDRFMIDYKYQGLGYGKLALKFTINYLLVKYDAEEIYLSIFDDNKSAIELYKNLGFKFNGEVDSGGEKVMVYLNPYIVTKSTSYY